MGADSIAVPYYFTKVKNKRKILYENLCGIIFL